MEPEREGDDVLFKWQCWHAWRNRVELVVYERRWEPRGLTFRRYRKFCPQCEPLARERGAWERVP